MTKNLKRFLLMLCAFLLCTCAMGATAFAAEEVTAEISVQIDLEGTLPETAESFFVELTAEDEENPMPEGAENGVYTMELKGEASDKFAMTFTKLGVYDYTVKQVKGSNEDCYQDESIYYVSVLVLNDEAGEGYDLKIIVAKNEKTEKCEGIVFENRYANPDEVLISAIKTLDGKTPEDGAFTFELIGKDGAVIDTVKNHGQKVTFALVVCDEEGTFAYQMREVAGTEAHIVYDETVYDVIVDVKKDGDGNYFALLTYEKDGESMQTDPIFANRTKVFTPQTGDTSNLVLMILLFVVSAAVVAAIVLIMRKRRRDSKS